ncbi:conjugal transfer protein TraF [Serratia symbiotica]|uniref:conjugal transfer protein TraF n=1 Tax=Serratia symbiotica TaxID=138074 RepID=UPI00188801B5|nr:conjugal transfer protein TraF [Serratia symbiotica]MBF1995681.1 conjugal transfer protein TraF [Serratia symbiotica]
MMNITMITRSLTLALVTTSVPALHAATTWTEARNDAMGGTGVASSGYAAAALVNAALMTHHNTHDHVGVILPGVGVHVSDPDNLQDGLNQVKDTWNRFSDPADSGNSSAQAAPLKKALLDVSGHSGRASAGVSTVVAIPNDTLPFALVVKGWGQAKARALVTSHDLAYLDAAQTGILSPTQDNLNPLTSRAEGVAALVSEYGLALAHPFTLAGTPMSVGITPKLQRVDTWNYNVSISHYSSSEFHSGEWKHSESGGNVDVGFSAQLTPEWTVGLTGQNLVSRNVETREVNSLKDTFQIRPQATAGTAWSNGFITLATDIDLTPASGFSSDEKARYAGVGAELNAWNWAQLRAGYRANMRNSDHNMFTAGIGISPFDVVHLDLTGMAGTHRSYGAAAQLVFTF